MNTPILLGIDGGGTYTRVVCSDLDGHVLARTEGGGANPSKNEDAEQNVQSAIAEVLKLAGRSASQIAGLVAGIAGLNGPDGLQWAERFTTLPGMTIKPTCVNDAVIAWAGALTLQPGIVVIAGTGCIVFGVTEQGRHVRNYDFWQDADATARDLTFATVFRIIANQFTPADTLLVNRILAHFAVASIYDLAQQAAENERTDRRHLMRLYGDAAPLITQAAEQGIPLASEVCERAAEELALGVRLVGSLFQVDPISYALIGSVAQALPIRNRLVAHLMQPTHHTYNLQEPVLSPETGAILLARQQIGLEVDPAVIDNLRLANG